MDLNITNNKYIRTLHCIQTSQIWPTRIIPLSIQHFYLIKLIMARNRFLYS